MKIVRERVYDAIVIGAGPSGLAVLHAAKLAGLEAVAIEKGPICAALVDHPIYMRWFSTADKLELGGFPFLATEKNPTRREYLKYCRMFVQHFELEVLTYHEAVAVNRNDGMFHVQVKDMFKREKTVRGRNLVISTGFCSSPREVGVPGEDLPKVAHRYVEAHAYSGHEVLIVGTGSSAAEAALEIWREGAAVTVLIKGERFNTRYWIEPDIENRIQEGSIACYRQADLMEIRMDEVDLRDGGGNLVTIANDFVLILTGYIPDVSLLEHLGAQVNRADMKPLLTEHHESTVPGLYVAGTLCAGCNPNLISVETGRKHGPLIVEHIVGSRR
jgi:thioredoxin reductase (NADPH)